MARKYALAIVSIVIFVTLAYCGVVNYNQPQFNGRLYYSDGPNLVEMNLNTGEKKDVIKTDEPANKTDNRRRTSRTNYDVSRDNNLIAYEEDIFATKTIGEIAAPTRYLVVMNRHERQRSIFRQNVKDMIISPLSISPNAKMLAFIADTRDTKGDPTLKVIRLSDGKTILSSIPAYNNSPTWSPDGTKIGFTDKWSRPVLIRLVDKKKEVLPGSGSPIWSPNGKLIAVNGEYIWSKKDKKKVPLKLPELAIVVGWAPDSEYLLYSLEDCTMHCSIYAYDIESKKASIILSNSGEGGAYPVIWRH